MIVTIRHIRAAKMCASGARDFFKRHNLDWVSFLKNGIPEEDLIATGDAMAMQVVEVANGQQ